MAFIRGHVDSTLLFIELLTKDYFYSLPVIYSNILVWKGLAQVIYCYWM